MRAFFCLERTMLKTIDITLQDRGKDLNFRITEMSAWKFQHFLLKVIAELIKTGILDQDTDDNDPGSLMQSAAQALSSGALTRLGNINPDKVQELAAELLSCVEFKVDKAYTKMSADNIDMYVQDVATLFQLQKEVIKLHVGFFQSVFRSDTTPSVTQPQGQSTTSRPKMSLR